jgi:Lipid A 3-O-deacylase (PagL)
METTMKAWILRLFNLEPKVLIAVLGLVALLVLGFIIPNCSRAAETELPTFAPYVQLSGGTTIVRGPAPVLDLTFTEPATQLRGAYWQESLTVIGSSTYKNVDAPNNFALRGLFVDGFGRFDVGLGLSWMQNPYPYNGSNVNFALQLGWRFNDCITTTYGHMSNAGTKLPNLGRDLIFIGCRFR